jgi:hypothetical protein
MKLKCDAHGRRVMSIRITDMHFRFVHRTGDKSRCDSGTASMMDNTNRTKRTFGPGLAPISTNKG